MMHQYEYHNWEFTVLDDIKYITIVHTILVLFLRGKFIIIIRILNVNMFADSQPFQRVNSETSIQIVNYKGTIFKHVECTMVFSSGA